MNYTQVLILLIAAFAWHNMYVCAGEIECGVVPGCLCSDDELLCGGLGRQISVNDVKEMGSHSRFRLKRINLSGNALWSHVIESLIEYFPNLIELYLVDVECTHDLRDELDNINRFNRALTVYSTCRVIKSKTTCVTSRTMMISDDAEGE